MRPVYVFDGPMACFQYFGSVVVTILTCHALGEVPCMRKIFVNPVEDKALINHVISTPEVTSEEVYKIRCFVEVKCESYNFGPEEGGGHVCELSDSDAVRDPLDFIRKQGFLYSETQNPCLKAQCPVNSRCHSNFENDTYLCACLTGFAGNNCEDIDECSEGFHGCHSNTTCNNTKGSYNCTCKPGYHGDGKNSCKVLGRTFSSPDGTWTAFWWYDVDITWPSGVSDVLAYDFGYCYSSDPYCFGRLPLNAIEASTEMLAVDSEGNEYKWSFDPSIPAAHAAWRAFHGHEVIPYGEVQHGTPTWNPVVLTGDPPQRNQDSFMYREEEGVKSMLLDDDGCDCYSTLSLGHAMCHASHSDSFGPTGQFGVDALYDAPCGVPRPGVGLTLYFRQKP